MEKLCCTTVSTTELPLCVQEFLREKQKCELLQEQVKKSRNAVRELEKEAQEYLGSLPLSRALFHADSKQEFGEYGGLKLMSSVRYLPLNSAIIEASLREFMRRTYPNDSEIIITNFATNATTFIWSQRKTSKVTQVQTIPCSKKQLKEKADQLRELKTIDEEDVPETRKRKKQSNDDEI